MRALALESFGVSPGLIDVPDPEPGPGEVLVRVRAASVNAFDVGVAAGHMKDFIPYEFPAVIGSDLAGTVAALGEGVERFSVGERVLGMMGMKGVIRDGSFGELATPQEGSLASMPEGLSHTDAASLAVAGTTAMSAVNAVEPGVDARILVIGATGGVGTFAVQLARLRGAHVIASVRPGDEDLVTALGAVETVDYTGDVIATIRGRYPDGIDAVIDAVSREHDSFAGLVGLVREGGRAASVVGAAGDVAEIGGVAVSDAGSDPDRLTALAHLVVQGEVRVAVTRTYDLADAAKALQDFTNEHTLGKKVITMP